MGQNSLKPSLKPSLELLYSLKPSLKPSLELLWLGWLACCAQPWLGLAWACLACLALAWSSNNNRPPSAAGSGFAAAVVAGPSLARGQGKASKTGLGQTKPRLGTTGKQAKPK